MKIGVLSDAYPNKRNINHKTDNLYVRINRINLNAYLKRMARMLGPGAERAASKVLLFDGYRGSFLDIFFYDIAHLFNTVSFFGRPWLSTFETTVPFFRREIEQYLGAGMNIDAVLDQTKLRRGLQACASDSCRALIALSNCTMRIQLGLIANFPAYEAAIKKKLVRLYPPQELLIRSFEEKGLPVDGKLKFMFVGREFYRKGGLEILRCFDDLSSSYPFEVVIVSALQNDIPATIYPEHESEAREIIERCDGTWLTHHKELDNAAVLDLMKSSHVGLLPTYSDTFGFSVLEFQACGCPVISTDVRALPEINNDDAGWIIATGEKTPHGEIADIPRVIADRSICKALKIIVVAIYEDRSQIAVKGNKAIKRIAERHSPSDFRQALTTLYER